MTYKPEALSIESANFLLSQAISFLDVPKDIIGNAGKASITALAIYTPTHRITLLICATLFLPVKLQH